MSLLAIVGKPNVGKSSLTNALLGKERNIVTPIAGTTRDSIATLYNKFGHEFMLVDTAGMRKKTKVHEDLEFYSVMRSIRARSAHRDSTKPCFPRSRTIRRQHGRASTSASLIAASSRISSEATSTSSDVLYRYS